MFKRFWNFLKRRKYELTYDEDTENFFQICKDFRETQQKECFNEVVAQIKKDDENKIKMNDDS